MCRAARRGISPGVGRPGRQRRRSDSQDGQRGDRAWGKTVMSRRRRVLPARVIRDAGRARDSGIDHRSGVEATRHDSHGRREGACGGAALVIGDRTDARGRPRAGRDMPRALVGCVPGCRRGLVMALVRRGSSLLARRRAQQCRAGADHRWRERQRGGEDEGQKAKHRHDHDSGGGREDECRGCWRCWRCWRCWC